MMSPIDFSKLVNPPEDLEDPHDLDLSQYAVDEALVMAERVGARLRTRQSILQGLSDASLGPREMTDVVVSDPALAAQVLKTVNSPYYGLRHQQASVFRAVLFLGHLDVRNIVLRACVNESFAPPEGPVAEALERLWQHSFSSSRASYAMAKQLGVANPDEIATAALLHDVGKLISLITWPKEALDLYSPLGLSGHELLAEKEPDLGVGHSALGQEVARMWGLPHLISITIGLHHSPLFRPPSQVQGNHRAIAIVHIANLMSHLTHCHVTGQPAPTAWLPQQGWLEFLGVRDGLKSLCTPQVVLGLLPPHLVKGDIPDEDQVAA